MKELTITLTGIAKGTHRFSTKGVPSDERLEALYMKLRSELEDFDKETWSLHDDRLQGPGMFIAAHSEHKFLRTQK